MENMSKEVKSELAQLRQGGWSLSGSLGADGTYFGDGDIFATKPNAENRPIKPESYDFVANLMYRLVEDCCGASSNGEGWNGYIVIDLTDGKTSIVVNSVRCCGGHDGAHYVDVLETENYQTVCAEIVGLLGEAA